MSVEKLPPAVKHNHHHNETIQWTCTRQLHGTAHRERWFRVGNAFYGSL